MTSHCRKGELLTFLRIGLVVVRVVFTCADFHCVAITSGEVDRVEVNVWSPFLHRSVVPLVVNGHLGAQLARFNLVILLRAEWIFLWNIGAQALRLSLLRLRLNLIYVLHLQALIIS